MEACPPLIALSSRMFFQYATGRGIKQHQPELRARSESRHCGRNWRWKTTLVNLLARFYEPTNGVITLDGVDYRESLNFLQSNLGVVLQTSHIFAGTVRENIRYGQLSATDEAIHAAAEAAGARQ